MVGYNFQRHIPNPDHFVNRYIDYASMRSDAPWDYYEVLALVLLSAATEGMKFMLPSTPGGIRTNLYVILYGPSTFARKSTSMEHALELQLATLPGAQLSNSFTPGSLEEQLAERPHHPSIVWSDEFTRIVEQMHNQNWMSGLRGLLLTMYGKADHTYRRTSKGSGSKKQEDSVIISDSHLCVVGNVTPAIQRHLKPSDIEDGFMARFAIVAPTEKPPRKGLMDMYDDRKMFNSLQGHLHRVRACVNQIKTKETGVTVTLDPDAVVEVDRFQAELTESSTSGSDENGAIMLKRVCDMVIKVAMLVAAGEMDTSTTVTLNVTREHVLSACGITRKWASWGVNFAAGLAEKDDERELRRIVSYLRGNDGRATRAQIGQSLRMSKWTLDQLMLTLMDRGMLLEEMQKTDDSKRMRRFWVLRNYEKQEPEQQREPGEEG